MTGEIWLMVIRKAGSLRRKLGTPERVNEMDDPEREQNYHANAHQNYCNQGELLESLTCELEQQQRRATEGLLAGLPQLRR